MRHIRRKARERKGDRERRNRLGDRRSVGLSCQEIKGASQKKKKKEMDSVHGIQSLFCTRCTYIYVQVKDVCV